MLRKLLVVSAISSAIFAVGSNAAFAMHHSYKGERDYKGEMPAPCPTYQYAAGPYLGLSAGVRNNYTGSPAVYKGIEGTLSAGYAAMLTPAWYLAGELFVGDSAQLKDYKTNTVPGNGVKTSWSFGFDLIPGYMITDYTLAYLRAGVVRSRFPDQSKNATGWQLGLGGQTNVYQNWDVRGEYVYSSYGSVSGIGHPNADQFNLGFIYKFL